MSCGGNGILMGRPLRIKYTHIWLAEPRSGQGRIGIGRVAGLQMAAKSRGINECKISAKYDRVPLGTPSREAVKVFACKLWRWESILRRFGRRWVGPALR